MIEDNFLNVKSLFLCNGYRYMKQTEFCTFIFDLFYFILFYLTGVILLYTYEEETIETCNRISLPREIGFSWGYALRELIYILAFYVGEAESVVW